MGLIRPATPGFLVTLIATILLAVVSFNVPIIKSIYFLKATMTVNGVTGSVLLGTLGYCLDLPNNQTCSSPSVGYQLDINDLLGNNTGIEIPEVVVKWITYALVLHIVALVLAGISSIFGLLAHVREMSMAYCSTCVSGFAASVALIAFIFDIVLFYLTKSRVTAVNNGKAEFGLALWLTLAAWVLLFFAGCFYGLGRCCISRRPRGTDREANRPAVNNGYSEQMRLEAVKAEADRKARQAAGKHELGLPAFQEYETQPLTSKSDDHFIDDGGSIVPYSAAQQSSNYAGGYAQAVPGNRAVDAYYNNSTPSRPSPVRQGSQHTQAPSTHTDQQYQQPGYSQRDYQPSGYGATPAAAATGAAGYLAADPYGHRQQVSGASYGHPARGTSYHSAVSHNDGYGQGYSDPFAAPVAPAQLVSHANLHNDTYNTSGYMYPSQTPTPPAATNPYRAPEHSYTLGGNGYGSNVVPALDTSYPPHPSASPAPSAPSVYSMGTSSTPAPINTSVPSGMPQPLSPRGPRDPNPSMPATIVESPTHEDAPHYSDSPPMYDAATAQPPGQWGAKR
ncbi:pali-domain-containing protein [Epithele typhae]|uniref:pali-domain-containing protein n=1 Tax=Epithele typhae TaxID=378194 RepID=UPI002007AEB9|nr:pali-domain-containing protein [Epithele typhae]KAH9944276.1 pali-domain-containing protein [Epithele typhae]